MRERNAQACRPGQETGLSCPTEVQGDPPPPKHAVEAPLSGSLSDHLTPEQKAAATEKASYVSRNR